MSTIYTIGHSVHEISYFISLLKKYDIDLVLDVRSTPFSKYAPQFNKEVLRETLGDNNIQYTFLGDSFGARQKDASLYGEDDILDFCKVLNSERFNETLNQVIDNINGANMALMCSEKEPIDCHRSILISRAFKDKGIEVNHILGNGKIETQNGLENRLLELYDFPTDYQPSLFSFSNDNEKVDYLDKAYKKRNKEIGYFKGE